MCLKSILPENASKHVLAFLAKWFLWRKLSKLFFNVFQCGKTIAPFVAPSNKYESILSKDAFTQVLSILAKWVSEKNIFKRRFSNYFYMKTIPLIAASPYSLGSWFEKKLILHFLMFLHKRLSYSGLMGFEKSFKNISLFIQHPLGPNPILLPESWFEQTWIYYT